MNHAELDRRSLAMARAVAERVLAQPELLEVARDNVARWQARPGIGAALRRCYTEWSDLLGRLSVPEIAELLCRDDEEGARLRQNSPFAGVLSPQEVWDVKRRFQPSLSCVATSSSTS